jgi:hypothetical protein
MARARGSNWGWCRAEAKSSQREADGILWVSSGAGLVPAVVAQVGDVKKRASNKKAGEKKERRRRVEGVQIAL